MRHWVEGEEEMEVCTKASGMLLMLIYLASKVKVHARLEIVTKISQLMLILMLQSQTSVAEAELVKMPVVA